MDQRVELVVEQSLEERHSNRIAVQVSTLSAKAKAKA
jgi:hypothetical protein